MRILLFFAASLVCLQTAAQTKHTLTITRLTGNFYVYTTYGDPGNGSSYPANSMYLVTGKGVVLFDTPWDTTLFQPLLDSIRNRHHQKVVACIATHFHDDRTAGFAFYRQQGIATYSTAKTDSLCQLHNKPRAEHLIARDSSLHLGGYSFQVYYPGPGHSPDNIVIWFAREKILYGGCLLKSTEATTLGNLGDADTKAWPATMQRLQQLCGQTRYTIPGHQGWADNKAIPHTIQLLKAYNQSTKK